MQDLHENGYKPLLKDINTQINQEHGPKGKIQYCKYVNFPQLDL